MRYTGPKGRQCRREGVNLFGSPKYQKLLARRAGIPGMHGSKRKAKETEYGKQLREKQKAKRMFCLSEKQFRRYFDKAARSKGITGENLLQFIEQRLDNALYRAGFAMTRMQSRQFASHGLFMVNGRRVNVPSIVLKPGDVVEIRSKSKGSNVFKLNAEERGDDYVAPKWLSVDRSKLSFEVVDLPGADSFEGLIKPQFIVEFYSR
jgi:small subunit ribosomal protein S4